MRRAQINRFLDTLKFVVLPVIFLGVGVAIFYLPQRSAEGIPSFARKYKTSCITCHTIFPKLTPVGEAFRRNGMRFPHGDEELVKEEVIELGSKHYRRVFPKAVYPGTLSAHPPISIRNRGHAQVSSGGSPSTDARFPTEIDAHMAGTFDEFFSYWVGAHWFENGGAGAVIRSYLRANDLFLPDVFDVTLGQFEPSVIPFTSHRKLTITDYAVNSYVAGQPLGGHVHGGSSPFVFQRGIEISGIANHHLAYAAGFVNGNGSGAGFDNNNFKDWYVRAEYKWGGLPLSGGEMQGDMPAAEPGRAYWRDDSIKVGTFYYSGDSRTSTGGSLFNRRGVDVDLFWRDLNVFGVYLLADDSVGYTSWYTQADYVILPHLVSKGTTRCCIPLWA